MLAKFPGWCPKCRQKFPVGTPIEKDEATGKYGHVECRPSHPDNYLVRHSFTDSVPSSSVDMSAMLVSAALTAVAEEPVRIETVPEKAIKLSRYQQAFLDFVEHGTGNGVANAVAGCLVGDTLIDTPRDLEKYPYGVPLRELIGQRPWVYGFDNTLGRIVLRQSSVVIKTGMSVPVYKVTFKIIHGSRLCRDDWDGPMSIIGTSDHQIMLRDRSESAGKFSWFGNWRSSGYKKISELKPGDRIMPLVRHYWHDKGYSSINLNNGSRAIESRLILSEVYGERSTKFHAHHKDERKFNQAVDNLEWKTAQKHFSDHLREHNLDGTAGWQKTGVHPRGMAGKPQTNKQKAVASITSKAIPKEKRAEMMKKAWETRHRRMACYVNHVVEKVEFYGYEDVYDITVPSIHNFVANGVVVHNSGKTFILVKALSVTPKDADVAFVAFNKHIVTELKDRQEAGKIPANATICTLHSLGMKEIRYRYGHIELDEDKVNGFMDEFWPAGRTIWPITLRIENRVKRSVLKRIVGLCKFTLIDYNNREAIDTMMERYGVAIDLDGDDNDPTEEILSHLAPIMEQCKADTKVIDFDDMPWLPVVLDLPIHQFDFLFVDECQDLNPNQIVFILKAIKPGGRIIAVGDPAQCQPQGTLVYKTGVGYVPIEDVKAGDQLMTYLDGYLPGKAAQGRKVLQTEGHEYAGELIKIQAGEFSHEVTPEHRCLIKMSKRRGWAVYVMRQGNRARVGTTGNAQRPAGSIAGRGRQENADEAWILGIFDNRADAILLESLVAYKYGLPQTVFTRKWEVNSSTIHTQGWLDKFWAGFPNNLDSLDRCLRDHGRDIRFPFWSLSKNGGDPGKKHGSLYTSITQACNLIEDWMLVCTFDGKSPYVKKENWKPVKLSRRNYYGRVYSLQLTDKWRGYPVYIAQGIVTHNSLYGFRGADTEAMPRLIKELHATVLPLSISYRCPKSHVVLAQQIVPELEAAPDAIEGEILDIDEDEFAKLVAPGDMVICRTNAPLVEPAYRLIRSGVKATIRGRDIGAQLINAVDHFQTESIGDLQTMMAEYFGREVAHLLDRGKDIAADAVQDRYDTLSSICSECASDNVSELRGKLQLLFSDDKSAVTLSSVHRAKGLEADRVFILHPELMPHPRAKQDWEVVQEFNVKYVSLTRAKNIIYFVHFS